MSNEIVTFGCRLNIYESEVIKQAVDSSGLHDVVVFNTCAVTHEAERQAMQAIRKMKKTHPDKKIIVTGCAAQLNPQKFATMPQVDKVIGNEEKLLPNFYQPDTAKVIVNDIMSIKETAAHIVSRFEGKSRAYIQVQNGCNHRCTFCTIPFARGNSRSVPIGVIVEQAIELVSNGYNEIVVTGVDISDYGQDLPGKPSLGQMLRRLLNLVPGLQRIRLSSIDVAEIDNELQELIKFESRIMPHLHISLQAGDDMILKRMKRRHNRQQVIEFCNEIRKYRRNVAFGADIIAGFPTESEEMFLNTKRLISEAGLVYLHVFPFSERNNTPASRMPQINKEVRKIRAKILREEGKKELGKFLTKLVGSKQQVIIEHNNMGRLDNFATVKLPVGDYHDGQIINIVIQDKINDQLIADVVK